MQVQASRIDSLLKVSETQPKDSNLVKTYIRLSVSYLRSSYDSALYYGHKANQLSDEIGYRNGYTASFLRIGNAYNYMANYDSAGWAYNKALKLFEEDGDKLKMSAAYNNLGLMYRYQADYPASLEHFMKSLELKKDIGSETDIGVAYQNIGIVFAIKQDFETAEGYLEDAVRMFYISGDSAKYYSAMIDISSLFRQQEKFDRSIDTLAKAYAYHKRVGNKTSMGICIYNMGFVSYLDGDLEQSLKYNYEARKLFTDLGNKMRITGCNLRIVTILLESERYQEAEIAAKEGIELFSEFNSPVQEYRMLKMLSEILGHQDKFKEAYKFRLDYEYLRDSITEEEQNLKFVELQTKYQKEINKREIAELTILARKKQIQNYVLLGVVLLVFLLAIMFYSRTRNKKRTNDTLREKNAIIQHSLEEKEVLLREIHHRVQNNLQFVSSLLNLQARRVQDETTLDVLKECKLRIQSMALIHQKLYQEHSLKGIDFNSYSKNLINSLIQSYQIDSSKIETKLNIDKILLDINTAIPIGLILNELVTNAFKYAFTDNDNGVLSVSLYENAPHLILEVSDNGVGLPQDFNIDVSNSFGLKLVRSLSQKLKAELSTVTDDGTKVIVKIKEYDIV